MEQKDPEGPQPAQQTVKLPEADCRSDIITAGQAETGKGGRNMTGVLLGAALAAFAVSVAAGRRYVPWLKENGAIQPLKKEVKERVYADGDAPEAETAGNHAGREP